MSVELLDKFTPRKSVACSDCLALLLMVTCLLLSAFLRTNRGPNTEEGKINRSYFLLQVLK